MGGRNVAGSDVRRKSPHSEKAGREEVKRVGHRRAVAFAIPWNGALGSFLIKTNGTSAYATDYQPAAKCGARNITWQC